MTHTLKSFAKLAMPVLAGAFTFAATPMASASLVIDQNFNIPGSALPTGWVTPDTSGSLTSIQALGDERALRIRRESVTNTDNVAYYRGTGVDGSLTNGALSDFTAEILMNTGNLVSGGKTTSSMGVVVNASSTAYAPGANSYYIGFLPVATGADGTQWERGFGIWRNVTNHTTNSTLALDFANFSIFTSDIDVLMQISYIGNDLSASIWTVDANGNALAEIASVSIDNAVASTGHLGLRGAYANSATESYFKSVQVNAIPEPSTALLLLPAAALLVYRKRRAAAQK